MLLPRTASLFLLIRMMNVGETDEETVIQLKQQLESKLDVYDQILSRRDYMAGDVSGGFCIFVAHLGILDLHVGWSLSFTVRCMVGENRWRAFFHLETECQGMVGKNYLQTVVENCSVDCRETLMRNTLCRVNWILCRRARSIDDYAPK